MGKLKILAKSHMLSKTAPIFCTFSVCLSVLVFTGNFSLFVSYIVSEFAVFNNISVKNAIIVISSVIGIVLLIFLCAPLRLGRERWFMMNAKGENPKFKEIFFYFSKGKFFRSIGAWLYVIIIKLASASVFFFPAICLFGVLYYCVAYYTTAFPIILCLTIADGLLFVLGAVFMFVYSGEFILYYPIIVSNETITFARALTYSKKMTSPVLLKISIFRLSFAPWWLLCLTVIPTFYCWGYYKQAVCELAYRNEYLN